MPMLRPALLGPHCPLFSFQSTEPLKLLCYRGCISFAPKWRKRSYDLL